VVEWRKLPSEHVEVEGGRVKSEQVSEWGLVQSYCYCSQSIEMVVCYIFQAYVYRKICFSQFLDKSQSHCCCSIALLLWIFSCFNLV